MLHAILSPSRVLRCSYATSFTLPFVIHVALVFAALSGLDCVAAEPLRTLEIWPKGVPGEAESKLPKQNTVVRDDGTAITSNVSVPTLTLYPAPKDTKDANDTKNKNVTVLVCPGGGYNVLAESHEGTDVCVWLNEHGFHAALLRYRVPRRADRDKHAAPLQDAQRAMTLVRAKANEWGMNSKRVGILGFSAGGHLSAMTLTSDGHRTYPKDAVDDEPEGINCVPDFGILVYPAYLQTDDDSAQLSPELTVTKKTPPTFLVVAHDDRKYVEGSARFYLQMLRKDRPCELHIFSKGGHGFGMRKSEHRVAAWPQMAADWMKVNGIVE